MSALSNRVLRAGESMQPFIEGMLEFVSFASDPEACDFMAGNPEEPALPGYVEALQKWLVPQDRRWFAYGLGDRRAQEVAATSLTDELDVPFEANDIFLTRGAHGALALAMTLLLDPGDEVVFVSPPWFFYEALITGHDGTPVRVRVDERTFDLDVDAIAGALNERTKIVLINTPNNPTGRIYPESTLERLAEVLRDHEQRTGLPVYLLSDESYSKVLFDGNRMVSPARWYERSLLVHTYSKSSLAPGQRLGFLALPSAMPEREAIRQASMVAAISSGNMLPDAVMQYALPDIEGIVLDVRRLQRRRDRVLEALRSFGYRVHTPEATFYLLPRSPIDDDLAFARRLAQEKVLVLPGRACEMPGYVRLSLTATDEMVERALPVLERAFVEATG